MTYRIFLTQVACRQLQEIPRRDQRQIQKRIDSLAEEPRPAGAKVLHAGKGLLRVRAGDYRIVYRIEKTRLVVLVIRIGHRREVYRRL